MAYTVKKLAAMSGMSVRTLHWYDEVGLLKPAWLGANGYRHYGEAELLKLQQILFYRELGFELKQIKDILGAGDFDKLAALESHRKMLNKKLERTRRLIVTIDKTIKHLKGTKQMKAQELFRGFSPEQQAKHEQYLVDRFGDCAKKSIAESKARVGNWTKSRWEKSRQTFDDICIDLTRLMTGRHDEDSREVQAVIRRHYQWLKQFWTPTRESYAGYGRMIEDSDLRKACEAHHAGLPKFMASAICMFAERELS